MVTSCGRVEGQGGPESGEDMQHRTAGEELAFKEAELNAAMTEAGFDLAHRDPEAARDLSFRARYIRSKSTFHPCLQAYLEYYSAVHAFSLKITTTDAMTGATYSLVVKNHKGSLKDLLADYFEATRKGVPLLL